MNYRLQNIIRVILASRGWLVALVVAKTTSDDEAGIEAAVQVLRQGGLVAFPTDTVYGLGADAANEAAVARIFVAKARPSDKPLQLLLGDAAEMTQVAAKVPDEAWLLAQIFMPGGLTLVLPKAKGVLASVIAEGTTVAVRVPAHPVALELIRRLGRPVAATSANRSGHPSPRTAAEAFAELGDMVDLVLDGGRCPGGIDSTIIDLSGEEPQLLREGAIPQDKIAEVLKRTLRQVSSYS